ncbi:hypothetical protein [Salmonella phage SD-15_S21]|nr:hypothetical protein [Salmonella phage SD-15_S21]
MLNERIKNALHVLNQEVNSIDKSTDRYKVMHEIKQELESINKGEWWYLQPEYQTRELNDVEKEIVKFITTRYCDTSENEVSANFNLTKLEVEEKFNFDWLDWLEMVMELEEKFNVEVDEKFENNETKLYELAEHIQTCCKTIQLYTLNNIINYRRYYYEYVRNNCFKNSDSILETNFFCIIDWRFSLCWLGS